MVSKSRILVGGLLAALGGVAAYRFAWDGTDSGKASRGPRPHIVVVLIDTLRADHTSLEDYHRDTTPGLVKIAAEGMVFRRHFANAPWTRPSVATILTGVLPPAHRCQWGDLNRSANGEIDLLPEGFDTLPEVLQGVGYTTHAFVTNPSITPAFGYAQGFDEFESLGATLKDDQLAADRTKAVLDAATGPTFTWCHLMAPHNYRLPKDSPRFPHQPRTPITERHLQGSIMWDRYGMRTREQAMEVYDRTILFADAVVTDLVNHIRSNHPNTLVVITSDHGEEFAEHGGYLHARTLYNELIRVPLVLWGPEIAVGETNQLSSLVDIRPTILDYLGIADSGGQGASLLVERDASTQVVYAEKRNGQEAVRALVTPEGKVVETKPPGTPGQKPPMAGNGRWEFFADLTSLDDQNTVGQVSREFLQSAKQRMEKIWQQSQIIFEQHAQATPSRGTLTEEDLEMLRELGYVE